MAERATPRGALLHLDWPTQRLVCQAVMRGDGQDMFLAYAIPESEQAIYRRMADDALAQVIRRRSSVRRYFRAPIRNPIRMGLVLATGIGLFAVATALWLARRVDLGQPQSYSILGAVAGFCAIGVAAIGWGVSGWITHRTARSKLTMDVVAARYAQPAFGDAIAAFNKVLKGRRIDNSLVAVLERSQDDSDRNAVQGLKYLLNYFEFISAGVLDGELDERIVARTLRGNLIYIYDSSAIYIGELQAINSRTLENFTTLRRHFRDL